MKLIRLEIRNFRSIGHLVIEPRNNTGQQEGVDGRQEQITTFVGKNNSGKSNILRALQFFFTASARSAVAEDVCNFADDAGTWVECTFGDLSTSDRDELAKYVAHDGTFRARRTLHKDGDRCVTKLRGYVQRPSAPWLQEDYPDYADMDKWLQLGIDVARYAELGARGGVTRRTFAEFRENYMRENGASLEFVEELSDTELKGRQSTAASVLPHFIFVPAVGDVASAIYGKQNSLLNEMVGAVIGAAKANGDYTAAQQALLRAQELVNPSARRLAKLGKIEDDLAEKLSSWPGTKVAIRTQVDDLAKILVEGLVLRVDDGSDTDLSEKGDGIQRQILFRVFQLYADFRAQRGVFMPDADEVPADRGPSIIAFEEPELFLHPQAQEQFYDDLLTVSRQDQVLLATHSSFLVRLEQAEGLHIVWRPSPNAPTDVRTAAREWLDADDRQRLKEINLCSAEVSKVFFADRVVVTEGQEDVIYIIGTAAEHAHCLDRRVTVVAVNGKERIPALQKVLNAFAIPYTVAYDVDPSNTRSAETSVRIRALIEAVNQTHGVIAGASEFDPNLPHVCHGKAPPPGDKPYVALTFIRTGIPTNAFVERVKDLFTI
jgi:putative ATP-dependent endonuclease of OLD family